MEHRHKKYTCFNSKKKYIEQQCDKNDYHIQNKT